VTEIFIFVYSLTVMFYSGILKMSNRAWAKLTIYSWCEEVHVCSSQAAVLRHTLI